MSLKTELETLLLAQLTSHISIGDVEKAFPELAALNTVLSSEGLLKNLAETVVTAVCDVLRNESELKLEQLQVLLLQERRIALLLRDALVNCQTYLEMQQVTDGFALETSNYPFDPEGAIRQAGIAIQKFADQVSEMQNWKPILEKAIIPKYPGTKIEWHGDQGRLVIPDELKHTSDEIVEFANDIWTAFGGDLGNIAQQVEHILGA